MIGAIAGDIIGSVYEQEDMGVRPTQLTENRKNRLAKLFRILTFQMCRSDTHALHPCPCEYGTWLLEFLLVW